VLAINYCSVVLLVEVAPIVMNCVFCLFSMKVWLILSGGPEDRSPISVHNIRMKDQMKNGWISGSWYLVKYMIVAIIKN